MELPSTYEHRFLYHNLRPVMPSWQGIHPVTLETQNICCHSPKECLKWKYSLEKKGMVFSVVTKCSLQTSQYFGGTCRLCLQGWKISQARTQQERPASYTQLATTDFLLGLHFNTKNGGDMFLWNVVLSLRYNTEAHSPYGQHCENLKFSNLWNYFHTDILQIKYFQDTA